MISGGNYPAQEQDSYRTKTLKGCSLVLLRILNPPDINSSNVDIVSH